MEIVSEQKAFAGTQGVYRHNSRETGTPMTFAVFIPPQAKQAPVPVLTYLSGLTCTHANVMDKAGAQHWCAAHGLALVMPDTSPRGPQVPDDPEGAYDMGLGAGFYVDATEKPWADNYRMASYITDELPALIEGHFPLDMSRQGIFGHSMGGHGALIIALKRPGTYLSVSAFAPIVNPMAVPWGQKALGQYLGDDNALWRPYDACALIEDGARVRDILIDQGTADTFLDTQLKPTRIARACSAAGIPLTLNMREGYDHSYAFIATFMGNHIEWHRQRL